MPFHLLQDKKWLFQTVCMVRQFVAPHKYNTINLFIEQNLNTEKISQNTTYIRQNLEPKIQFPIKLFSTFVTNAYVQPNN